MSGILEEFKRVGRVKADSIRVHTTKITIKSW